MSDSNKKNKGYQLLDDAKEFAKLGDSAKAQGNLQKGINNYQLAIKTYDQALKADKGILAAKYEKGFTLAKLGDALSSLADSQDMYNTGWRTVGKSLKCFKDALKIHPDNLQILKSAARAQTNRNRLSLNPVNLRLGDIADDAKDLYDKALKIYPNDLGALKESAKLKKYSEEGLELNKRIYKLSSDNDEKSEALCSMADIISAKDKTKAGKMKAIDLYNRSLELKPNKITALEGAAGAYFDLVYYAEKFKTTNEEKQSFMNRARELEKKILSFDQHHPTANTSLTNIALMQAGVKNAEKLSEGFRKKKSNIA